MASMSEVTARPFLTASSTICAISREREAPSARIRHLWHKSFPVLSAVTRIKAHCISRLARMRNKTYCINNVSNDYKLRNKLALMTLSLNFSMDTQVSSTKTLYYSTGSSACISFFLLPTGLRSKTTTNYNIWRPREWCRAHSSSGS